MDALEQRAAEFYNGAVKLTESLDPNQFSEDPTRLGVVVPATQAAGASMATQTIKVMELVLGPNGGETMRDCGEVSEQALLARSHLDPLHPDSQTTALANIAEAAVASSPTASVRPPKAAKRKAAAKAEAIKDQPAAQLPVTMRGSMGELRLLVADAYVSGSFLALVYDAVGVAYEPPMNKEPIAIKLNNEPERSAVYTGMRIARPSNGETTLVFILLEQ